jgi:hypothetical protein
MTAVGIPAVPIKVYGSVAEPGAVNAPREILSWSKITSVWGTIEGVTIKSKQLKCGPMVDKISSWLLKYSLLDTEAPPLDFTVQYHTAECRG